ncbi:MAG: T9SS type A sorting domain-containing protein, partial [Flavobacteriales bacterium]
MSFAQVPTYVPTTGLVGWWPFNGNANDESGNGNNGTVNGASLANDRNAVTNSAYSFDGTDWIEVNHNAMFDFQTNNAITVSTWFETSMTTGAVFTQKQQGVGATQNGFNIGLLNGSGSLAGISSASGGTMSLINTSTTGYNNSIWHHFVYEFDNQVATIYLDGTEIITQTDAGSIVGNSATNLIFGYGLPSNNYFLTGKLDDIGIWNRALTACEIQDLYHTQLGYTTVNAGTNQTVCNGDNITLTATGASTYTWNNNVINGQAFAPTSTQDYIVTGTDSLGCTGTDTVSVVVLEPSSATQTESALDSYTWPLNNQVYSQSGTYTDTIPNAAGCDSIVTLNLTLNYTGIHELNQSNLVISPNPTKDIFTITGLEQLGTTTSLELKDANGKVVKELDPKTTEFSISELKAGIYFLEITAGTTHEMIKLVKE